MSTQYISFKVKPFEARLILRIVERAQKMMRVEDWRSLAMDITACHANGTPLDLERLLSFPDFDFIRDVSGISCEIDRRTGKLENFFLPRCARPKSEVKG